MVLASAGDDGEVSFWKKNGTRLGAVPCRNVSGGSFEVQGFFFFLILYIIIFFDRKILKNS